MPEKRLRRKKEKKSSQKQNTALATCYFLTRSCKFIGAYVYTCRSYTQTLLVAGDPRCSTNRAGDEGQFPPPAMSMTINAGVV